MCVNIERLFPFFADIVFRSRCITCIFVVNIKLIFGSDAVSKQFPVIASAPTFISVLEPSVFMYFHYLFLFSMNSSNIF